MRPEIVIDTNVFIAALRSRRGTSYKLLTLIGSGRFEINVSVPLILEYETVARRHVGEIALSESDIDDILDYLCKTAKRRKIYYLWRPVLKDPKDDMVLELAVTANCDFIVTFNKKDFPRCELGQFGIQAVTPREFLQGIGELK